MVMVNSNKCLSGQWIIYAFEVFFLSSYLAHTLPQAKFFFMEKEWICRLFQWDFFILIAKKEVKGWSWK